MKIQYASDLHLEFKANFEYVERNPIKPKGEILVLAGDIIPFEILDSKLSFFLKLSDSFEAVYWLPGNHEYYGYDLEKRFGTLYEEIVKNVFLVNNTTVQVGDIKLVFSSLWSKISKNNAYYIQTFLNDFKQIRKGNRLLNVEDFNALHEVSVNFLQRETALRTENKIAVFTHHCPTFYHYPIQYKNDPLNEAFATELYGFIADSEIDAWIYGHHHSNTSPFKINKTQMLTNQLGYIDFKPLKTFKNDAVIEL